MMHTIRTSSINTAFLSILNHSEFLVTDPLRDQFTGKFHATAKAMAANSSLVTMSTIAQAGVAHFDLGYLQRLKTSTTKVSRQKIKKQMSDDMDSDPHEDQPSDNVDELEVEMDSVQKVIATLVRNQTLPKIEDFISFFKKAFSNLQHQDFLCLQSIIQDLWILQPWTRPLDYKEEVQLQKLTNNTKESVIDLTKPGEDSESEKIDTIVFKKLSSRKLPANSNLKVMPTSRVQGKAPQEQDPERLTMATPSSTKSYSAATTDDNRGSSNRNKEQRRQGKLYIINKKGLH